MKVLRLLIWTLVYASVVALVWTRQLQWWWVATLLTVQALAAVLEKWNKELP